MNIRKFCDSDIPVIWELMNWELGYSITENDLTSTIAQMKKNNDYDIFVAEYNNTIIGFIGLHIRLAFEFQENIIHIIALAVKTEYQRHGIGTKLIQVAESYAIEHGSAFITVNSGMQRIKAHGFYTNNGFYEKGYSFGKIIK